MNQKITREMIVRQWERLQANSALRGLQLGKQAGRYVLTREFKGGYIELSRHLNGTEMYESLLTANKVLEAMFENTVREELTA